MNLKVEKNFRDFYSEIFSAHRQLQRPRARHVLQWRQVCNRVNQTLRTKQFNVLLFGHIFDVPEGEERAAAVDDVGHDGQAIENLVPVEHDLAAREF